MTGSSCFASALATTSREILAEEFHVDALACWTVFPSACRSFNEAADAEPSPTCHCLPRRHDPLTYCDFRLPGACRYHDLHLINEVINNKNPDLKRQAKLGYCLMLIY